MGRCTITEILGDGQYTVSLDYGQSIIDEKIANRAARLAELESFTPALVATRNQRANDVAVASSALNSAINDYEAARTSGGDGESELAVVKEKTRELGDARIGYDVALRNYNENQADIASVSANIDYYQGFDLTSSIDVWCADYTVGGGGQVGTIEIPGEPVQTLIVPDCAVPVDGDGLVTARPAQSSEQLYYNLALLPGWQKYAPTYRLGEIYDIDRSAHTCNVTLDDAFSSAQGLDINQETTLYDVPVVYMTCHSWAFSEYDRVVVKFLDQDFEQPQVIGFETHPKVCTEAVARIALISFTANGLVNFVAENEQGLALLNKFRVITSKAAEVFSDLVVEMRPEGESWYTLKLDSVAQAQDIGGTGTAPILWKYTASGQFGGDPDDDNFRFWMRDTTGDFYDWSIYGGNNQITYDTSYEMTQPITLSLYADYDNFVAGVFQWPKPSYEIRIRSTGYPVGDALLYFHVAIRTEDNGIFGVKYVDQDFTSPRYGSDIHQTMVLMTDYAFPPDP